MKRVGYLWEKLVDRESIRLAIRRASRGGKHRRKALRTMPDEEKAIDDILAFINDPTYVSEHDAVFYRKDPSNGKTREIHPPRFFPDLVIEWAVLNVLYPILYRDADIASACNMVGRGTHYLAKRLSSKFKKEARRINAKVAKGEKTRNRMAWAYQDDFHKFFDSIGIDLIEAHLRRKVKDERFIQFVMRQFNWRKRGVLLGRLLSQHVASVVLAPFDAMLRSHPDVTEFARYMDDVCCIGRSKDGVKRAMVAAHEWARLRGLSMDKPRVYRVSENCPICGCFINFNNRRARRKVSFKVLRGADRLSAFLSNIGFVVHSCVKNDACVAYLTGNEYCKRLAAKVRDEAKRCGLKIRDLRVTPVQLKRVNIVGFEINQANTHIRKRTRRRIIALLRKIRRGSYLLRDCFTLASYKGAIGFADATGVFSKKYLSCVSFERAQGVISRFSKNNKTKGLKR